MLDNAAEMTTIIDGIAIITVEAITILGLVLIEVEVLAMIDIEVLAATVSMIEGVSVVVLQALIEIDVLIVGIDIMIAILEMYTETIAQTDRETPTVEEMSIIGLPPLRRNPYWVRKTRCPRSKSAFDRRGYSKAEHKFVY
jgi:hypothetical protein